MFPNVRAPGVTERWVAILVFAASLFALAAVPGVGGLATAAIIWIFAFAILEHAIHGKHRSPMR
jgi:hypothetical protein